MSTSFSWDGEKFVLKFGTCQFPSQGLVDGLSGVRKKTGKCGGRPKMEDFLHEPFRLSLFLVLVRNETLFCFGKVLVMGFFLTSILESNGEDTGTSFWLLVPNF